MKVATYLNTLGSALFILGMIGAVNTQERTQKVYLIIICVSFLSMIISNSLFAEILKRRK
jgi:hypothetical protein